MPLKTLRSAVILVAALLTAPAAADPGGADDPSSPWDAPTVLPGSYTGTLGGGDDADWFRVEHPAKYGVVVTVHVPAETHVHLALVADDGTPISEIHVSPGPKPRLPVAATAIGGGGTAVRIGVLDLAFAGPFEYAVEIGILPLPDLAVAALEVENVKIETDWGSVGSGVRRAIRATIANEGLVAGFGFVDFFARTRTDGATQYLGSRYVELEPGASTTATIDWTAVGVVGDVTILAQLWPPFDADRSNDLRTAETYVLVGGTGLGVTGTSGGGSSWIGGSACPPLSLACAQAGTDLHWAAAGIFLQAPAAAAAYAGYDLLHRGGYAGACTPIGCLSMGLP